MRQRLAIAGVWIGSALAPLGCLPWSLSSGLPGVAATPPSEVERLVEVPAAVLPAPEGLRATSGDFRAIPLKWDPLLQGEVGGYRLENGVDLDGPFTALATVPGRGVISYIDRGTGVEGLGDGETRFYRLRAYSSDGRLSDATSEVVVATTAPVPPAPEGLRAYSRQPREVPLSWRPSPDPLVVGYVVERSPALEGPYQSVARTDGRFATTWLDRGLGDLRVFYYRVSALNPAGSASEPSEPVRAVTKPVPLPPIGLAPTDPQKLGSNELTWEPNVETDLVGYRLYRLSDGAPPELAVSVSREMTTAGDATVTPAETVTYVLVAVDRDGLESDPSIPITVESERYGLEATLRPEGVHLRWRAREGEGFRGARILRSGWPGTGRTLFTEQGSYVDADVTPGRSYRYIVTLVRGDGSEAPPSLPLEVTVPRSP